MIELINRARANPAAEMARYGLANLNEGLNPGTITADAKQPLAVNRYLTDAARKFSAMMLQYGFIGHGGVDGSSPQSRMAAAGYVFDSSNTNAENAGVMMTYFSDKTERFHMKYFLDYDNLDGGRGHRVQMLLPNLKELGAGIIVGNFPYNGSTLNGALISTMDFAATSQSFLTGVAYTDKLLANNFYTEGEGMAGVKITAVRNSDGKVFTTTTLDAGGYSLPLADGTYHVYGSGGALTGTIDYGNVSITGLNKKVDFTPAMVNSTFVPPSQDITPPQGESPFASVTSGLLSIAGTNSADTITVTQSGSTITVTRTGSNARSPLTFSAGSVSSIQIEAGEGDDIISIGSGVMGVYVNAGMGNDLVVGGDQSDTLTGAGGKDSLQGGSGDDRINGGVGNDSISGDDGNDRLYGNENIDIIYGVAGIDRIWGGDGNDAIYGGASNDKLYGEGGDDAIDGGNQNDYLEGGAGDDTLIGGAGNDTVMGNGGADRLFGNAGTDVAYNDVNDIVDGFEAMA